LCRLPARYVGTGPASWGDGTHSDRGPPLSVAHSGVGAGPSVPRQDGALWTSSAAAGTPCGRAQHHAGAVCAFTVPPLPGQAPVPTTRQGHRRGPPTASDAGGYADAAAQDCVLCPHRSAGITILYDQSPMHKDPTQAPRGGFSGPALGGFTNLRSPTWPPRRSPFAVTRPYGVCIEPGMGLRKQPPRRHRRRRSARGTSIWVNPGQHFNGGCCFDYGKRRDRQPRTTATGTMETHVLRHTPTPAVTTDPRRVHGS